MGEEWKKQSLLRMQSGVAMPDSPSGAADQKLKEDNLDNQTEYSFLI